MLANLSRTISNSFQTAMAKFKRKNSISVSVQFAQNATKLHKKAYIILRWKPSRKRNGRQKCRIMYNNFRQSQRAYSKFDKTEVRQI